MKHISCVEIQIKHFPLWSDIKKKQQQFNSKMWHCCFPYLFIKKNFWTEFMILDGSNNKNYFFLFVFVSVSFWLHVYVCMYLCTSLWLRSYKNIVTNCWCYRVPAWISNSKLNQKRNECHRRYVALNIFGVYFCCGMEKCWKSSRTCRLFYLFHCISKYSLPYCLFKF